MSWLLRFVKNDRGSTRLLPAESLAFSNCDTKSLSEVVLTSGNSRSVASLWNDVFLRHGLEESNVEVRLALFGVRRYCPSVAFPYADGQDQAFETERGIIYNLGILVQ